MAKKKNFEESYSKLEAAAAALKNESVSLEDSIKLYEEASKHYGECRAILDEAKQRLAVLDKDTDEIKELEQ
ncbi:MAG: exodeoxyribonuclease VII small subunit [Bacillota bacterium]|nr:exodeoxyribonuclease VII small subunit [Bacillota bacterium]